jgi:hypothetical protein
MRLLAPVLLAMSVLLPLGASAQDALNKCIDAQGKITYSNLPCRNAREARTVEIDPAPQPDPVHVQPVQKPAQATAPQTAPTSEPATLHLDTRRITGNTNAAGKPVSHASPRQCDTLTDKLGRVFDKMDQARRKGYTQQQMDAWNREVKDLERQKQQSGCF